MSKWAIACIVAVIVAVNVIVLYRAAHSGDALREPIPAAATLPPAVNAFPVSTSPVSTSPEGVRTKNADEKPIDLLWPAIQQTKLVSLAQDTRVEFAPELRAAEGKLVRVSGVLFFIKDGIQDGKVKWCVLMPPSRYTCCGISCDPRQELMFFIDCSKAPWPRPETKIMAVVQGRLKLRRDDSLWCLYSLEDAEVTLLPGAAK